MTLTCSILCLKSVEACYDTVSNFHCNLKSFNILNNKCIHNRNLTISSLNKNPLLIIVDLPGGANPLLYTSRPIKY